MRVSVGPGLNRRADLGKTLLRLGETLLKLESPPVLGLLELG